MTPQASAEPKAQATEDKTSQEPLLLRAAKGLVSHEQKLCLVV